MININKKITIITLIVGLLVGGGIIFAINNIGIKNAENIENVKDVTLEQTISAKKAGEKIINIINNHMLPSEMSAFLVEVVTKNGLYKIVFNIQGQEQEQKQEEIFYLTKDGKLLLPKVINLDEFITNIKAQKEIATKVTKCEKFQAELTPERKEKIAKCLTERGYQIYLADWCSVCIKQKEMFGEAVKYLTSINCYDPEGKQNNIDKCPDLQGVPAWRDKDENKLKYYGQVIDGMIPIRGLVAISGCKF